MKLKINSRPKIEQDVLVFPEKHEARKIIFSHRRSLGDMLMFSAGIRDFKLLFPYIDLNIDSNIPEVFNNNPYLNRAITQADKDVEFYQVGYPAVCSANNTNVHFSQMFLLDMISITDAHRRLPIRLGEFCAAFANGEVGDPCISLPKKNAASREPFISLALKYKDFGKKFARQRGDLHLSDKEKCENLIKDMYGIDHYWVIAPGGKRDCTAKIWDWRKFQDVVKYFDGLIKFVVIGRSDLLLEKLSGVIDLTDKFNDNLRGLFSLVYHATGCVSGPSALMHIAAAMPPRYIDERKPCVSIFGGREPIGWSWYTNHQILHTNGVFSCCTNGGCWKARVVPLMKDPKHNKSLCRNAGEDDGQTVQACMAVITAKDVIRAIEKYYEGDLYKFPKKIEGIKEMSPQEKEGIVEVLSQNDASVGEIVECVIPVKSDKNITVDVLLEDDGWEPADEASWNDIPGDPVKDIEAGHESIKQIAMITEKLPNFTNFKGKPIDPDDDRTEKDFSIPMPVNRKINLLGNLNSSGGGEQSLCMIAKLLMKFGWDVTLFPCGSVHENYESLGLNISPYNFETMADHMFPGVPLLFYGNDSTRKFCENGSKIVEKSSSVIIGINYVNKPIPTCKWLAQSGKVKAFIFQNSEKKAEFEKEQIGFDKSSLITMYGAIDLQKFLQVCPPQREKDQPMVILKHCTPDWRKYVTKDAEGKGNKIHIWQKQFYKENDIKFYSRLLKEFPNIKFEFMEAHKEIVDAFSGEPRMKFHKWNSVPVEEFLSHGHLYLYRSSNCWRDQYPRVVAEALAAGLPVLSEPRDGTKDRVQHGDTGFYCTHYDEYALHIKTLLRKEGLRHALGMNAKEWSKINLNPLKWVEVIEEILCPKVK